MFSWSKFIYTRVLLVIVIDSSSSDYHKAIAILALMGVAVTSLFIQTL